MSYDFNEALVIAVIESLTEPLSLVKHREEQLACRHRIVDSDLVEALGIVCHSQYNFKHLGPCYLCNIEELRRKLHEQIDNL